MVSSIRKREVLPSGSGSLNFIFNESPTPDDYLAMPTIPSGFGNGAFTMYVGVRPDGSYPYGITSGADTAAKTNWSSEDIAPPGNLSDNSYWNPGNFLLDGHNNLNTLNGTFSLNYYGSGRLRWIVGDGVNFIPVQGAITGNVPNVVAGSNWGLIVCIARMTGVSDTTYELWYGSSLIASVVVNRRVNFYTAFWQLWTGYIADQSRWIWGAEHYSALNPTSDNYPDHKGLVNQIAFFNADHSLSDINGVLLNGIQGTEPGYIDHWNFNEQSGNVATSENGLIATLNNMNASQWSSASRI